MIPVTREPVHEPLTSFGFGTIQGFAPRRNPEKEEATAVLRHAQDGSKDGERSRTMKPQSFTSYLSIGSNLGDRIAHIDKSIHYLRSISRIKVEKISDIYESLAQGGPKNQPKFLNAAVKIKTELLPLRLLQELKTIELKLKRKKTIHWGPRTIDLDILFYDDLVYINNKLSIPHPLLHKRVFVLKPLSEIAPDLSHPLYKKSIKELLKGIKGKNNEKIIPLRKR